MAKKKHPQQRDVRTYFKPQDSETMAEQEQQPQPQPQQEEETTQNDHETTPTATPAAAPIVADDDDLADKLSSLRSLNEMLLTKTAKNREEISALEEDKKSLETQLTRSDSEADSVRAELTRVEEELRSVEAEKEGLRSEIEAKEVELKAKEAELEKLKGEHGAMAEVVREREEKVAELCLEVEGLKGENAVVSMENEGLQKAVEEGEKAAEKLSEVVEAWQGKCLRLEERNAEVVEELRGLKGDFERLVEEKKAKEADIERLVDEKSKNSKMVEELEKEKARLEEVNSTQGDEIRGLGTELDEIRGNVSNLEMSNNEHLERNSKLESELNEFKGNLVRVTEEQDEMVYVISRKLEEKEEVIQSLRVKNEELEEKNRKLVEDHGVAVAKIGDLEDSLKSKNQMYEATLGMMKNMAMQMCDGIVMSNERSFNGEMTVEMEPCVTELEAIRAAFRSKDEKYGEMEKQMERLECCVEDVRKQKNLWTMVSSATTVLAAVISFAYAARVR